jgi:D-glucosaminate-6-phosphate ammonia-lyase
MKNPLAKHLKRSSKKNSGGATRRELFQMGNLLAVPALMTAFDAEAAPAPGPLTAGPNIYQSIGVEPVINCRGTFTIIGASIELPEVRAAVDAGSQHNVQLDELAEAVGRRLSELTGAEWGMVSAGCAAGLKQVALACIAGGNPEKLIRVPDLTGMDKTEVVSPRGSRSVYDHAIRNTGVQMINVDTIEQMANAFSSRTAMVYMSAGGGSAAGPMSVANVVKIAKARNIPVLVDAAAENLTIPNIHLQQGADIVAYSGGKAIRGPQCAGLLLGRKDLLMSAWQASSPHHGPGRDNKVGCEEVLGMLAAVEAWVKRDHDAEWKTWMGWLDTISKRVTAVNGVTATVREPQGLSNHSPVLVVSWDPAKLHLNGEDVGDIVATTKPRIALAAGGGGTGRGPRAAVPEAANTTSVTITAFQMRPGDAKVVADRLYEVLSEKRSPKPAPAAPAGNVSGRWDVTVEFFSSKSQHTLTLTQEGSRIAGSHKGDYSSRDVVGTMEGDKVRLRSQLSMPGDSVPFIFDATLAGDTLSGPIFMGEYLNAKFTAKRSPSPAGPAEVRVPVGHPLAN